MTTPACESIADSGAGNGVQIAALRALHLRWGEFPVELADWTITETTIDRKPRGLLGTVALFHARRLAAAIDAVILEIPAYPFQTILFPHRNPFKNLLCLLDLLHFLWKYLLLLGFLAKVGKPLLIFDLQDSAGISARFLPLLKLARRYHKRELPKCLANTFLHSEHFAIEPWRNRGRYAAEIAKLRPLSIGAAFSPIPFRAREKGIDIFWAGTIDNSPVRERGVRLLRELEKEGYCVVVFEERVDQDSFFDHVARAWLTFCPDGNGWQCWRTLEVACLGSVPLLSYPTIWQDEPFRDGEHCFYYDPEGDDLKAVARRALANKTQLTAICAAVRRKVSTADTRAAVYHRHLAAAVQLTAP